jgi:hypothetical protein
MLYVTNVNGANLIFYFERYSDIALSYKQGRLN